MSHGQGWPQPPQHVPNFPGGPWFSCALCSRVDSVGSGTVAGWAPGDGWTWIRAFRTWAGVWGTQEGALGHLLGSAGFGCRRMSAMRPPLVTPAPKTPRLQLPPARPQARGRPGQLGAQAEGPAPPRHQPLVPGDGPSSSRAPTQGPQAPGPFWRAAPASSGAQGRLPGRLHARAVLPGWPLPPHPLELTPSATASGHTVPRGASMGCGGPVTSGGGTGDERVGCFGGHRTGAGRR